jgi:1-acyl-sn-glycerol-3-phosphate acyltransferase
VALLRSILFTTIMFVSVPPSAVAVLIARLFGREVGYASMVLWCRIMIGLCEKLCGLSYTVEGYENLPDKPGVMFIKHSSAYETFAQFLFLPRQCWVLKRELMWAPFLGWALAVGSPIAINRSGGKATVQQVIEQGKKKLADGLWVNIFPEGTRMAPGETRRYGISGTLLAQAANTTITPLAHNAGDFWPRRGLRKRPGVVRFVIGKPVDPAGRDPREVNEELQKWVEATVARLRRES